MATGGRKRAHYVALSRALALARAWRPGAPTRTRAKAARNGGARASRAPRRRSASGRRTCATVSRAWRPVWAVVRVWAARAQAHAAWRERRERAAACMRERRRRTHSCGGGARGSRGRDVAEANAPPDIERGNHTRDNYFGVGGNLGKTQVEPHAGRRITTPHGDLRISRPNMDWGHFFSEIATCVSCRAMFEPPGPTPGN